MRKARKEQLHLNIKLRTLSTKCSLLRLVHPRDYRAKQLGREKI